MEYDNTQTIEFVDCGPYHVKLEPEIHIKEEPVEYEALEDETIGEEPTYAGILAENNIKEEPIDESNFNENSTPHFMELDSFLERGWIEGTELDVEDMKLEPKIELDCDTQSVKSTENKNCTVVFVMVIQTNSVWIVSEDSLPVLELFMKTHGIQSLLGQAVLLDYGLQSGESAGASLPAKPGPSIKKTQDSSADVENRKTTYFCHSCPYKTTVKRHLDRHAATHAGSDSDDPDKQFKCELCSTRFSFQRSLTLHRKNVHSIKRPFKCDQCSYSAARGNHLRLHVMSKHLNEKPIECALCDYRCVQKGNMLDHIRNRHSGGEPFKCDRCRYQTSQREELITHITRTHLSKVLNIT